jgi:GntR family negative regulator for fad regulon and positive regulator of fabA
MSIFFLQRKKVSDIEDQRNWSDLQPDNQGDVLRAIKTTLLRPKEYAVKQLLTLILNDTFPSGSVLPAERELAKEIGVTRQTLREVLQRLESEGWITIQHGKPTIVNDYWQEGGHGILSSIAGYAEELPKDFVRDLTEFRIFTTPVMTEKAAARHPEILLAHLLTAENLENTSEAFVEFDWQLQRLAARHSGNKIFSLMLNDYIDMFHRLGQRYFSYEHARTSSLAYYRNLAEAIRSGSEKIKEIVEEMMQKALDIWIQIQVDGE